jgi:hypothetical protein
MLDIENLFTQNAQEVYQNFIGNTKTPIMPSKNLFETGMDINRWFPREKMEQIARFAPEFDNNYQGLVEIGRINQTIWGEDANVIRHPYVLLEYLKANNPILFTNGFGNLISFVTMFHDAGELYLEEDGHPRICDYVTGTKSRQVKDFENQTIKEIIYNLPIHDLLKDLIIGGCNKEGKTGKILANAEKGLFVESSKKVIFRMQNLRGRQIPYNTYDGGIKLISGDTLNKFFEIAEETSSECIKRMRDQGIN